MWSSCAAAGCSARRRGSSAPPPSSARMRAHGVGTAIVRGSITAAWLASAPAAATVVPLLLLLVGGAGAEQKAPISSAAAAGAGGLFGEWFSDEFGLPAFNFTCDEHRSAQIPRYSRKCRDSAMASGQAGPFAEDPTTAIFHIGNDRLVVLLSTHGYAQVREDQGGAKLLNDVSPAQSQFGGGLGYLVDAATGRLLLSTYHAAKAPQLTVERHYGVGYARRRVQASQQAGSAAGLEMEHRLVVPFGSDPIVISQTVLVNRGSHPLQLSYYEVWGGAMWQMAYGQSSKQRRAFQDQNYVAAVQSLSDSFGLTLQQRYNGSHAAGAPPGAAAANATLYDEAPPLTFFCNPYEHDVTTETACDAHAFFGAGGAAQPAFGMQCGDLHRQSDSALILRRNVSLAVGEKLEFAFAYGVVQSSPATLISKYSFGLTRGNELLTQNGLTWRSHLPDMRVAGDATMSREVSWHHAMARQTLTYSSYFNEFVLDQGTAYRYSMGFQGAARDPLQHVLPFIHTDGSVVRSVVRSTLKELTAPKLWKAGDLVPNLPYFVIGHGIVGPPDGAVIGARPSDEELYLLFTVSEYVLATRDTAFLLENVTAYNSTVTRTVLGALVDCFLYIKDHIGVGRHGLMKMQTGDWNDVFVQEAEDSGLTRAQVIQSAESTANAAMASFVLPRFADVVELASQHAQQDDILSPIIRELRRFAVSQTTALRRHAWNGAWISRAWIPVNNSEQFPGGWACTNGFDNRLCLEPQPWALLASEWSQADVNTTVLSSDQATTLVASIESRLCVDSPLGCTVLSKVFSRNKLMRGAAASGQHENGGVWASQNHPLILALAHLKPELAYKEWVRNSRATQAQHFPSYWAGIWSASDVVTSHLSTDGYEGCQSWPAMPVLCTHPHSWPVYSAARLAGLTFDKAGMRVHPALPLALGDYSWTSTLASVRRNQTGELEWQFSGHWAPLRRERCSLQLDLRGLYARRDLARLSCVSSSHLDVQSVVRLRPGVFQLKRDVLCGGNDGQPGLEWSANVHLNL